jgi:hypothetical protein
MVLYSNKLNERGYKLKVSLKKVFIILGSVTIIIFVYIHYFMIIKPYEKDYFGKAGIKGSFFYNDVIKSKGSPLSERITSVEGDYDYMESVYKGYIVNFSKPIDGSKSDYMLMNVIITDPLYKVGRYKIRIGSTMDEVRKAYRGIKVIVDVKYGYIDGKGYGDGTWIEFKFDKEKKVKQICIYHGP